MNVIYEPKGKAREYAELAINLYKGCEHRCRYCYGARGPYIPADRYYGSASPKAHVIERLKKDCNKLNGQCPEILLSFLGDVYQPAEMELCLTRQTIEMLIKHNLPFTILTKGGTRAARDFDLLASYPKARFGTTLIFLNQGDAEHWEPGAASITDRVEAIRQAHERGIKTWISLEPVIDPAQALQIVRELYPIVDHWKVGKINYHHNIERAVDWAGFRLAVTALLDSLGADYYLKRSLYKYDS